MRSRLFAVLAALAVAAPAYAQKQVITLPGGRGGGMLSPAVRVGDLVFVSGQTPARTDSTMDMQTTTELTKIKAILEAAGTSNGFCVASLVLGIIGLPASCVVIPSILAIIFGVVGYNQVAKMNTESSGKGMAIAGMICGGVGVLLAIWIHS